LQTQTQTYDYAESLDVLARTVDTDSKPLCALATAVITAAITETINREDTQAGTRRVLAELGLRDKYCEHVVCTHILGTDPTLHLAQDNAQRHLRSTDELTLVCGQIMPLDGDSNVWTRALRGDWQWKRDPASTPIRCQACAQHAAEFEETSESIPTPALDGTTFTLVSANARSELRMRLPGILEVEGASALALTAWGHHAYVLALQSYAAMQLHAHSQHTLHNLISPATYRSLVTVAQQNPDPNARDLANLLTADDYTEVIAPSLHSALPAVGTQNKSAITSLAMRLENAVYCRLDGRPYFRT
jgi:hypothetical protein